MKITEYPKASSVGADDVLIIDGQNGTKIVTRENLMKSLSTIKQTTLPLTNCTKQADLLKRNGVVQVVYNGDITTLVNNSYVTLGTLPAEYRPLVKTIVPIANQADRRIAITIGTDGVIQAYNYGTAISEANNFAFNAVFMAANV